MAFRRSPVRSWSAPPSTSLSLARDLLLHRQATRPDAASIARLVPRCALAPAARGSSPLGDSSRCDQGRDLRAARDQEAPPNPEKTLDPRIDSRVYPVGHASDPGRLPIGRARREGGRQRRHVAPLRAARLDKRRGEEPARLLDSLVAGRRKDPPASSPLRGIRFDRRTRRKESR
jgi:hypothetical protein